MCRARGSASGAAERAATTAAAATAGSSRSVPFAIRSTAWRYRSRVARVMPAYVSAGSSRSIASAALAVSTNSVQSMPVTRRRLAMEFAITSCVSANSCADRCAASSTVIMSSATHGSSQSRGVKSERRLRICWRKRVRNAGVRSGPRYTNADSAFAAAPNTLTARRRDTHSSAEARSATSRAARSAIRRTLSRYPMRNIAGIAQSSPSVSVVTR